MSDVEYFDTHFVTLPAEATVGQALSQLQALEAGDSWHVVVNHGDGTYQVVWLTTLRERWFNWVGAKLFDLRLIDLPDLVEANTIPRSEVTLSSPKYWRRKAREQLANLFLVIEQKRPIGRIWAGVEKDAFPASTMGQLYGDFVDTHVDARGQWRPENVTLPVCPHCKHQGFFRYRLEENGLYCSSCKGIVHKTG